MNHVAHRANSVSQKPSPHSGMHWCRFPIRACIDSHPRIRAYIDSGGKQVQFVSFRNWFHVIASSNDVIASKFVLIWKALIKGFHLRYYGFCNLKIWPSGTPFLTLVLTMKVTCNRPSKVINWVADQKLLSHQVWSSSNKKYSKNKVFISIMT
jgi:hypothetical protein